MFNFEFSHLPKAFKVFYMAESRLKNEKMTQIHGHDFYEIFFIKEGCMNHFLNEENSFKMNKGDLCLIYPEDIHYFKKEGKSICVFMNIAIEKNWFKTFLELNNFNFSGRERYVHLNENREACFIHDLIQIGLAKNDEVIKKGLINSLLLQILIELKIGKMVENGVPFWLLKALKKLQNIEVSEINESLFVNFCNRSQCHVIRTMKKFYGITPTAYCNYQKIKKAREILLSTEEKVISVCNETGFNNLSYFNKLFKRYYGISPREVRRQLVSNLLISAKK